MSEVSGNTGGVDQSFAQHLLEKISENISSLILMVVLLQEQNADLPIDEITLVANAAASVAEISTNLASEEYQDYPDLQKEILDASSNMLSTKQQTLDSIRAFPNEPNRKRSWDNISEHCRSIGNETIKILHVVYGAEMKRLIKNADIAKQEVESINIEEMAKNPEEFANHLSGCIAKILKFASLLKLRAQDEQGEWLKSEYVSQAHQMEQTGNRLITQVNELLMMSDEGLDPMLVEQFNQTLLEFAQTITSCRQRVIEMFADVNKSIGLISVVAPSPSSPSLAASLQNGGNTNNAATSSSPSTQPSTSPKTQDNNKDFILEELFRGTSRSVTDLLRATYRGEFPPVQVLSASLTNISSVLTAKISSMPNASEDVKKMCQRLAITIARFVGQASEYVNSPEQGTQIIPKIGDTVDEIQEILQTLLETMSSRESQLMSIIRNKQDYLSILSESREPLVIVGTLKNLKKNHIRMEDIVRASDPADLNQAVQQIATLLPQQINVAKEFLRDVSNPETRRQLCDINTEMRVPLAHLVALMEPTTSNEAKDAMTKERSTSSKIIDAARRGEAKLVDSMIRELEQVVSNLVSIATSETTFDQTSSSSAVADCTEQLIAQLSKRRTIATNLVKNPTNDQLQRDLEQINQTIASLSMAVAESVTSNLGVLLHKIKTAAADGHNARVEAYMSEISNKTSMPIHTVNTQESIKKDPIMSKLFSTLADDLMTFVGMLFRECRSLTSAKNQDTRMIEYLGEQVLLRFNDLQHHLSQHKKKQQQQQQAASPVPQPPSPTKSSSPLTIVENARDSPVPTPADQQDASASVDLVEEEPTEKKILVLFDELLDILRKSDVNKTIATLKELIGEQNKLMSKANDLANKSYSKHYKAQVESSVYLFKSTMSLVIAAAGRLVKPGSGTVPGDGNAGNNSPRHEETLNKYVRTVKKSIVELGYLLKFNPHIEVVAAYNYLSGQSPSSDPNIQRALCHFKEFAINFKGTPKVTDLLGKIDHFALSPLSLECMFEILLLCGSFVLASSAHQVHCRYHILSSYEMEKDGQISDAMHNIIHHQTELIKEAQYYLSTVSANKINANTRKLITNSLQTANQSLSQQVEASVQMMDKKPREMAQLDKLITIIDVIRESVDNSASAAFNSAQQIDPDILINQSIAGFIPSLSLSTSKALNDQESEESKLALEKLVEQITSPLEQIELNMLTKAQDKLDSVEEKLRTIITEEKSLLSRMLTYLVETDKPGIVDVSKAMVKCHQDLVGMAESTAKDDTVKDSVREICHELAQLIPQLLQSMKSVLQSNEALDLAAYQKPIHISNQIKRNITCLQELSAPSFVPRLLLHILRQHKQLSQPESNEASFTKLRSTGQSIVEEALLTYLPFVIDSDRQQRIREAIAKLEEHLKNNNNNASSYEEYKQALVDSAEALVNELSMTSLQLLASQQQGLCMLVILSVRGNFKQLVETQRTILAAQQKLKMHLQKDLQSIQDPSRKHLIFVSLGEMDVLIPEIVKVSKEVVLNPQDYKKREQLELLYTKMESPMSTIFYQISQMRGNLFDNMVKNHQSVLIKLDDALRLLKRADIELHLKSLEALEEKLLTYLEVDDMAAMRPKLQAQYKDLSRLSKEYIVHKERVSVTPAMENEKDMALLNLLLTVGSLVPSLSHSANSATGNGSGDMDQHVNIKSIIQSVKSNNILNLSKNPERVQKFIAIQQNGRTSPLSVSPKAQSPVFRPRSMMITPVQTKAKQPMRLETITPMAQKPKQLEVSIRNVAKQVAASSAALEQLPQLAQELENYATHIKANQRQSIVQSGRTISALINQLCMAIVNITNDCSIAQVQTRLYQVAQTLKTLGCQIKILSGVKAVSPSGAASEPDSDLQLTSLVNMLGSALQEVNSCINTLSISNK
ncbi:hypothetical protein SAMD00019534_107140 [Acytostelium subglobosum LB1]|uniref:hypothetical protein n=1 Tax=Acytostelium subglobosum LB1 TaxID=1410327 RepID=UPI000644BEA3|nr:hypothetical protein SAMD00019534_107140 [Acytostelium subglobosum LB1]GAM27538.1 hypothetical protein SAMD00019534_107140 [Acytostelium subglobosum LB1]|eukprot:XP_012749603.1 hypothetical protein SAMD00019534_107140 [Acytostelium subglobosum LB1]